VITFVVRRLAASVIVLFGVSVVVFLTLKLIPGDAAYVLAGPNASAQEIEAVRQSLGLDQPIPIQYLTWLGRALHGDLGRSLELHEPVLQLVLTRYVNTLILASSAIVLATTFGVLAGTIAALHPHSALDRALMLARMTRASLLEVLSQEYVLVARSKGLREHLVVRRHALKNALLPVLTVIGLQMGALLGGAVITETIFSWPGIGFQLYRGIALRDVPLVQGAALVIAASFVAINLVIDLLYSYLDPRIRYS
jgi:peptide/nickel transport system permease protein/oligopeptide transport system permease protein